MLDHRESNKGAYYKLLDKNDAKLIFLIMLSKTEIGLFLYYVD